MILKKTGFCSKKEISQLWYWNSPRRSFNENSTFSNIFCKQRIYFRAVNSFWRLIGQIAISVNFQFHCEVSIFSSNRYIIKTKCKNLLTTRHTENKCFKWRKEIVAYLMTFSTPVCLFSLLHERSKKNFDRKQVCPITLSIKRPLRVAALFLLTTIGLKSIYWVSLEGGTFGTIFFIKKAQNTSLSCFCKHGTERNDRQTNKQTKERLESRL